MNVKKEKGEQCEKSHGLFRNGDFMKNCRLGENIAAFRRQKLITQEKLADFLGVTKASVSKWENGLCMPDVVLLPQLASFFGVSIDVLMGYEPNLSPQQILKLCQELKDQYAATTFEEAMEKSREEVKKYFSCYPFLFQICVLWMNHYNMAKESEQRNVLAEICDLCTHIMKNCKDIGLCNDTLMIKASANLLLGNGKAVIEELEELKKQYGNIMQTSALLIQAYQMTGEHEKAVHHTQISMYTSLMMLLSFSTTYLDLQSNNREVFEETVNRGIKLMKAYHFETLHPNSSALFYYHAAIGYCGFSEWNGAMKMLEGYVKEIRQLMLVDQVTLHGDDYFTEIGRWMEEHSATAPRNEKLIWQTAIDSMKHPAFSGLEDDAEYLKLKGRKQLCLQFHI